MYCTLQEAYQIPSFAARRKKPCVTPLNALEKPYDPQGVDEGSMEFAPAYRKYSREDFADAAKMQKVYGNTKKPTKSTNNLPFVDNSAYTTGQASDYKYYEKYGLQYPKIATEGFEDQQCQPNDAIYRIPVSEEAKQNYDAAMAVAINPPNQPTSTELVLGKQRTNDMNKVTGYYDEDLEQYLKVSEMKAAPMLQTKVEEPYEFKEIPSPFETDLAKYQSPRPQVSYLMDLILFVLCGLLVILLCDQLYRIALTTGVRETIDFLRPYLEKTASL